ncbi:outer membrane beta-barrel protein [Vibrio harveyi]|uniref:outer membrane beta-barrel protein n=1 Tax=Vibrio harveyi TaxID=669 RepID=UPI003CE688DB
MKKTLLAVVASTIALSSAVQARPMPVFDADKAADVFGYDSVTVGYSQQEIDSERAGDALHVRASRRITEHTYIRGTFSDFKPTDDYNGVIADVTTFSVSAGVQYSPEDFGVPSNTLNFYGDVGLLNTGFRLNEDKEHDNQFLVTAGVNFRPCDYAIFTAKVEHPFGGDLDTNPTYGIGLDVYPLENVAVGIEHKISSYDHDNGKAIRELDSATTGLFVKFKY